MISTCSHGYSVDAETRELAKLLLKRTGAGLAEDLLQTERELNYRYELLCNERTAVSLVALAVELCTQGRVAEAKDVYRRVPLLRACIGKHALSDSGAAVLRVSP